MPLQGGGDHRITPAQAAVLTRRHREQRGARGPRAFAFGREAFDAILAQPGCDGVRLYLALGEDGEPTLVAVGITAAGADLAEGEVMDRSLPCPPFCPEASVLGG
ncbi:MAG TPA: hypothetical protein VJ773_02670 [Gemmatimonadales bacterium]|nr:hypothetical protein [Gemmatimonadales bacterium]